MKQVQTVLLNHTVGLEENDEVDGAFILFLQDNDAAEQILIGIGPELAAELGAKLLGKPKPRLIQVPANAMPKAPPEA